MVRSGPFRSVGAFARIRPLARRTPTVVKWGGFRERLCQIPHNPPRAELIFDFG